MVDGFSENTFKFLVELRLRNDREWYNEHKPDYERFVLKPLQTLVSELAPTILRIDPLIETTPAIGKTISRVYRDSRFTTDKSLYRDRAWLTFCRKIKEMPDAPAFYFEMTPSSYRYGVGFYSASLKTMEEYRALILRDEDKFANIIGAIEGGGVFDLEGESYKKDRYAGSNHAIAKWYNHKSVYLAANRSDITEIFDFQWLSARLIEGFASLSSIYRFWCEAAFMESSPHGASYTDASSSDTVYTDSFIYDASHIDKPGRDADLE